MDRRDEEIEQLAIEACSAGDPVAAIRNLGVSDPAARKLLKLAKQTACRA